MEMTQSCFQSRSASMTCSLENTDAFLQKECGLSLISSLPLHLFAFLLFALLFLYNFFVCFEVLFLGVVCIIKKHLQSFLVQGWNVSFSSRGANQIPFQSLLLLNEMPQTVNASPSVFIWFFYWSWRKLLNARTKNARNFGGDGGCRMEWAVNFCQALRCVRRGGDQGGSEC